MIDTSTNLHCTSPVKSGYTDLSVNLKCGINDFKKMAAIYGGFFKRLAGAEHEKLCIL